MSTPLPIGERRNKSESVRALVSLTVIMIVGTLATLVYALQTATWPQFASFATIGLMIAGASLLIGGLLGFLFGIPRTLQQDTPVQVQPNNGSGDSREAQDQQVFYRANTNLEQISDWLTKILVGVGLTQITVIPDALQRVAEVAASGLDGTSASRTFVCAVMLFFVITGFLFGYLWTRLFLPGAFRQADLSALVSQVAQTNKSVEQVNKKIEELENQAQLDAKALSLAQRQLNSDDDLPAVSQEELNSALRSASSSVRIQIFTQAHKARNDYSNDDSAKLDSVIPIFRALIAADIEGKFHRNHGQLGIALKNMPAPDLAASEAELTRAIEIRGPWKTKGWLYYEFHRAIARIKKDESFIKGEASKPEVKEMILEDLRAAATDSPIKYIRTDSTITAWMKMNGITETDLELPS